MEQRLGDGYRLGPRRGSTVLGYVHEGVREEPDGETTPVVITVLGEDVATAPGVVDHLKMLVNRVRGVGGENLAPVRDVLADEQHVYVVADHVPGRDLRGWIAANGPMLPSGVAEFGIGVATALAALHDQGVAHLGVTADSLLVDGTTARLTGHCVVPALMDAPKLGPDTVALAMPQYVAPELLRGEPVGPPADLYALGAVLYQLCCGVPPFGGKRVHVTLADHVEHLPGRPEGIPDPLWSAICALMAKNPADRPSARELIGRFADLPTVLGVWSVAPWIEAPPPAVTPETVTPPPPPLTGGFGGGLMYVPGAAMTKPRRRRALQLTAVGRSLNEAKVSLPGSVELEAVPRYSPDKEDGTVLEQLPLPGKPLEDKVRLVVARDVVPIQLDTVEPVTGRMESSRVEAGVATMAGKQYLHSLGADVNGCTLEGEVDFLLSKAFGKLTATVGLDDESASPEAKVHLEVLADNRKVAEATAEYGKVVPIEADLTDVLRLRVQWQLTTEDSCGKYTTVVLGTPMVHGFPETLPTSGTPAATATTTRTTTTTR
ncbi:serine/threonine-protein kinase [Saccharothrix tamanrassetensis]|uniref:non-specific serine/threonine protein kinase n=1 Tax=Saccharothrix tamanrassetensis TaxID=1051531 RepID=A0A841CVZ9_9PSEU|nr:protein kinase [Saccharothrix tamanrassetensis]MBB5960197.1 serine/threonine-protein kinase [Saccharothrix tamanrassetensis]